MPGAVASPMVQKLPALRSGRFWPMPPRRPLVGGRVVLVASQGCEPRLRGGDRWATDRHLRRSEKQIVTIAGCSKIGDGK